MSTFYLYGALLIGVALSAIVLSLYLRKRTLSRQQKVREDARAEARTWEHK